MPGRIHALMLFLALGCARKSADDMCVDPTTPAAAPESAPACARNDTAIDELTQCLATSGPDECRAKVASAPCDADRDGIDDDLELAIARAYAPAFAFSGGDYAENTWPANAQHFVSHARLMFGDDDRTLIDAHPTLASIASAVSGGERADQPCGGGPNFWLCLNDTTEETRVSSSAIMRALPDGVDVMSVVHPANDTHLFVSFSLLFAFNQKLDVGDHEGDWEGIAVFVNRKTGAVDAAYFERHDTTDNQRLIKVADTRAIDPRTEGQTSEHGVRFWDYAGSRRHVVAYVATGSHAMYDTPTSTRLFRLGPRDTHAGDGDKLLSWSGRLVPSFTSDAGEAVKIVAFNPGEPGVITLPWARYRGQWGCSDGMVGKSWPGPFGNGRHGRPMYLQQWSSL